MRGNKGFFAELWTPGTVPCALACAVLGILAALLLLWGGIWRALLVAALVAVGVFLGGVRDKKAFMLRITRRFRGYVSE